MLSTFQLKLKPWDIYREWLFTCICFNKIRQNVLFVPVDYIGVVSIQVEKSRGNPHEKYRGVPKGGVIKDVG